VACPKKIRPIDVEAAAAALCGRQTWWSEIALGENVIESGLPGSRDARNATMIVNLLRWSYEAIGVDFVNS
jgi:hypothetical protein